MPELPEVDRAARRLRSNIVGRTIARVAILHRALARRMSPARLRSLRGATVQRVDRRGKHQLIVFEDDRVLHVHFRMSGDWRFDRTTDPLPRHVRAVIELTDGSRVSLDDPRALSTIELYAASDVGRIASVAALGPEADDPALTAASFRAVLGTRRGPIKPVLLDQRVVAGLGNIYAAEALWRARISPMLPASSLDPKRAGALVTAIRAVLRRASGARYRESSSSGFAVYDREGRPCRRCGTSISRIVQAGRSTYFCAHCQADMAKR